MRAVVAFVMVLGMAPLLTACGPDKNDAMSAIDAASAGSVTARPDDHISGDERDYQIHVTSQLVLAGNVTFTMTNYGSISHEMLVVKTDIGAGLIPIGADQRFNESDPRSTVVGEISEYGPGTTKSKTLNLAPGNYQLVCNIPDHYGKGMAIAFKVIAAR